MHSAAHVDHVWDAFQIRFAKWIVVETTFLKFFRCKINCGKLGKIDLLQWKKWTRNLKFEAKNGKGGRKKLFFIWLDCDIFDLIWFWIVTPHQFGMCAVYPWVEFSLVTCCTCWPYTGICSGLNTNCSGSCTHKIETKWNYVEFFLYWLAYSWPKHQIHTF